MASVSQARIHVSILRPLLPLLQAHAWFDNAFVRIQSLMDDSVASMNDSVTSVDNAVSKLLQTVLCTMSLRLRIVVVGVSWWLEIVHGFRYIKFRSVMFHSFGQISGGDVASIALAMLPGCGESAVINAVSYDIVVR